MKKPKFPVGMIVILAILIGSIIALNVFTARNAPVAADEDHAH